jgi:para-nitrobenzyl esterase
MKNLLIAASVALATISAPAMAADAAAAPAAHPAFSTAETDIGTLLDNPATKAVLDKQMPGFADNPQIAMARSMTLKQIQGFAPDQISDAKLAAIDADLAAIPAK